MVSSTPVRLEYLQGVATDVTCSTGHALPHAAFLDLVVIQGMSTLTFREGHGHE